MWRFLFEIDWTDRVEAYHLPVDHPLPLLVDRINKLNPRLWDALWVRLVDVAAALSGRQYSAEGTLVFDVPGKKDLVSVVLHESLSSPGARIALKQG